MPNEILQLAIQPFDDKTQTQVISFDGPLDKATLTVNRDQIEKIVYEFPGKAIIFDFSRLKFINSESIGFLMMLHTHLQKAGKKLALAHASSAVKDVLTTIGLTQIVPCADSVEECISLVS